MTSTDNPTHFDTILCLLFQKDRIGASIYRDELKSLEVTEFWDQGPLSPPTLSDLSTSIDSAVSLIGDSYPALQSLLRQVCPTLVLVPSRSPDSLISVLSDHMSTTTRSETSIPCALQQLKPSYYSYEQACAFLSSQWLPDLCEHAQMKTSIASFLNFDEKLLVRASGALLSFLSESRTNAIGPTNTSPTQTVRITTLTRLELDGRLHLENGVYEYLQIFRSDQHPSAFGGQAKEGISLFSLYSDRCFSKAGVHLLKHWLLTPLCDPSLISQRLDSIELLWRWITDENEKLLRFHLRHACDLRLALSRLSTGTATSNDWIQVKEACNAAIRVREMLVAEFSTSTELPELFQRILQFDDAHLYDVHKIIGDSLDLTSTKDKRPGIRGGVDSELDRLRSIHADLDGFLDRIAKRELSKFPGVTSLRVIYVPQIGFQIAVPSDAALPANNPEHPVLQFTSDQWAYYRTNTTQEMNEMIGDVSPLILDRIELVLRSVSETVLKYHRLLLACSQWMAELDVLCVFTKISKENALVRPLIQNPLETFIDGAQLDSHRSGMLRIVGGRHLLLEHVLNSSAKRFVPNSSLIGRSHGRFASASPLHVVVGPNGSGKSVYLTQLGLIVFMAHIGCFVAAEEAVVAVVDQIFAFSSTNDAQLPTESGDKRTSVTVTGSGAGSFLNDTHKMGRMLRNATPLSLVLIDEFGRGTTESDAESLLVAFIEKMATPRPLRTEDEFGRKIDSEGIPKIIVSTHLKILNTPALQHLSGVIDYFHMNVLLPELDRGKKQRKDRGGEANECQAEHLPTYLYQLTPVSPQYQPVHLGIWCAKTAGMSPKILERANDIKNKLFRREEISAFDLVGSGNNGVVAADEGDVRVSNREEARKNQLVLDMLEKNFGSASVSSMDTLDAFTFMSMVFPKVYEHSE